MKRGVLVNCGMIGLAFLCFGIRSVSAVMSSSNYQILWDSVGTGGSNVSSSASYNLRDSLGVMGGLSESDSYQVSDGYRAGIYDRIADFSVFSQSLVSQVAALSRTADSVTVTNVDDFEVGDYIVVIQDEGAGQVSAIGRVIEIVGDTLKVDEFTGGVPTIDGSEDYVYVMSGETLGFGVIPTASVATTVLGWEVSADVSQGYSVYVFEDHDLMNEDTAVFTDVADGAVTAGVTEYGGQSSDTTLALSTFDTSDTAFSQDFQQVASNDNNTFARRDFLTLKVSRAPELDSGSYSQTLTLVYVGDY